MLNYPLINAGLNYLLMLLPESKIVLIVLSDYLYYRSLRKIWQDVEERRRRAGQSTLSWLSRATMICEDISSKGQNSTYPSCAKKMDLLSFTLLPTATNSPNSKSTFSTFKPSPAKTFVRVATTPLLKISSKPG